jgi:multidrug efflux pump subunit AcrA (membrane-fusion protein)
MLFGQPKGKTVIFRQAALDRLSSPEQMDQLMGITTPRGWVALAAAGMLVLTTLVWSLFGHVSAKVTGTGILIRQGGIANVVAVRSGLITDIYADAGEMVQAGQIIAKLGTPDPDAPEAPSGPPAGVVSIHTGRVVEVLVNVGNLVHAGDPIVRLEAGNGGEDLTVVAYVPVAEGKKVMPGMRAEITPTTVKREEYGFLYGAVEYVSPFPATSQGMMRVLANDQLVRTLSSGGAPIAMYIRLQKSSGTPSGYAWSSVQGPPAALSSGTLCSVSVVIEEQRPIGMVIPFLKKKMGMGSPELR